LWEGGKDGCGLMRTEDKRENQGKKKSHRRRGNGVKKRQREKLGIEFERTPQELAYQ